MSPNIKTIELQSRVNFTCIMYKSKSVGMVEYRRVYGNNYYYAHVDNSACEYNSFEDAVAHLLWRNGLTIKQAHAEVGIK